MKPFEILKLYGIRSQQIRSHFIGIVITGSLLAFVELITPMFSKLLFDFIFKKKEFHLLGSVIFVFAIFHTITFVLKSCLDFYYLLVANKVGLSLRDRIFTKIQQIEAPALRQFFGGDLIIRLTDDIERAVDLIVLQRSDLIFQLIQVIGNLAICLWVQPQASFIIMLSVPVYLLVSRYLFMVELGLVRDRLILKKSETMEYLHLVFRNTALVRAFDRGMLEAKKYQGLIRWQLSLQFQDRILKTVYSAKSQLGFDIWSLYLVWYFGMMLMEGRLTEGDLLVLCYISLSIRQPLIGISQQFGRFRTGIASLRRIHEVLNMKSEEWISQPNVNQTTPHSASQAVLQASGDDAPVAHPVAQGRVEISQLVFVHKNSLQVTQQVHSNLPLFSRLSLTVEPGSNVILVGDEGAGKSTLLRILNGEERRYEGSVSIDGCELKTLRPEEIRKKVLCIHSEHGIFPGTIRENISYGNPDASDEEIKKAAKIVGLWSWIRCQPQELNTFLKNNEDLSKTERQKLALARVFLVNPSVVLLDEMTEGLDSLSLFQIQQAISNMSRRCSVISVTRDLSSLKYSNKLLFLQGGRIEEQGHFDELIKSQKKFFQHYVIHYSGFIHFSSILQHEIERSLRYNSVFTLAGFEIKGFQKVTGNLRLDQVKKLRYDFMVALAKCIRTSDNVTELGQSRFLVLFAQLNRENAVEVLSRIELKLNEAVFQIDGFKFKFEIEYKWVLFDGLENKVKSAFDAVGKIYEKDMVQSVYEEAA